MPTNHLETIKQVYNHLQTIIEKIDSLDFFPITWDDSFLLLHELETVQEDIYKLTERLETISFYESFCNDVQNKAIVENLDEVYGCFEWFSMHFSRIYSVLEDEGPKEWYDKDYECLSAQLKNAKQHLDQINKGEL
jgi:hypothetical protein